MHSLCHVHRAPLSHYTFLPSKSYPTTPSVHFPSKTSTLFLRHELFFPMYKSIIALRKPCRYSLLECDTAKRNFIGIYFQGVTINKTNDYMYIKHVVPSCLLSNPLLVEVTWLAPSFNTPCITIYVLKSSSWAQTQATTPG